MGKYIGCVTAAALLTAVSTLAVADDSKDRAIAAGKTHFINNCADCHGADGRGGGTIAGTLEKSPTNLTPVSYTHLTLPTICFNCRCRWWACDL